MVYMENYFDKWFDLCLLVDGVKFVILFMLNYFLEVVQVDNDVLRILKYVYGKDYYYVIKDKLKDLVVFIMEYIGEINVCVFVDLVLVFDKVWVECVGLGWIGKNVNLIYLKVGFFFFVVEVICDLELSYDYWMCDYCGICMRCIDVCFIGVIVGLSQVDGLKCIFYLMIELKDELLFFDMKGKMGNWMFGCDVCQDVCLWNCFFKFVQLVVFCLDECLLDFSCLDWEELIEEVFCEFFCYSVVKWMGFNGLKCNICFFD